MKLKLYSLSRFSGEALSFKPNSPKSSAVAKTSQLSGKKTTS
ncbi:hypothetical protein [Flavobacterium branchiophilum]|nr:hypothetical protein [Flavobacterium branchiophilum]